MPARGGGGGDGEEGGGRRVAEGGGDGDGGGGRLVADPPPEEVQHAAGHRAWLLSAQAADVGIAAVARATLLRMHLVVRRRERSLRGWCILIV